MTTRDLGRSPRRQDSQCREEQMDRWRFEQHRGCRSICRHVSSVLRILCVSNAVSRVILKHSMDEKSTLLRNFIKSGVGVRGTSRSVLSAEFSFAASRSAPVLDMSAIWRSYTCFENEPLVRNCSTDEVPILRALEDDPTDYCLFRGGLREGRGVC